MTLQSCPHPRAEFTPAPLALTEFQRAQGQMANKINVNPTEADSLVDEYRPILQRIRGLDDVVFGSHRATRIQCDVEAGLRHALVAPLGHAMIGQIALEIQTVMNLERMDQATSHSRDAQLFKDYHAERTHLVQLSKEHVGGIIAATFNTYTQDEQRALTDAFRAQTHKQRETVGCLLDVRHPGWKDHSASTKAAPYDDQSLMYDEAYWLTELLVSDDIRTSLVGAAESGIDHESTALSHFQTALYDSECPDNQWWPLSYANLGKLAIFAHLTDWSGKKKALESVADPAYQSLFKVSRGQSGSWDVGFRDTHIASTYEHRNTKKCQGAIEKPFNDQTVCSLRATILERAGEHEVDTDIVQATSAAHMLTLLTVAWGERNDSRLNRQAMAIS